MQASLEKMKNNNNSNVMSKPTGKTRSLLAATVLGETKNTKEMF